MSIKDLTDSLEIILDLRRQFTKDALDFIWQKHYRISRYLQRELNHAYEDTLSPPRNRFHAFLRWLKRKLI